MASRALIVGGTGPSGPHIVEGLCARGFDVTVFHRGAHEPAELSHVRHLHGDPHFREPIDAALGKAAFDVVVATYGRVSHLAEALEGRVGHFLFVGGPPRYAGFSDAGATRPTGLPVPVRESAALATAGECPTPAARFAADVVSAERRVFEVHPSATCLLYPVLYGPRNVVPWEWSLIKRVRDRRRRMVLPDGGLAIFSRGAPRNVAEFVLRAVDRPFAAGGKVFNCADDVALSVRQFTELVVAAAGGEMEIVAVPSTVAPIFRAMYVPGLRAGAEHCLLDTSLAQNELGYTDVISPAAAIDESVGWYAEHPVDLAAASPAYVDTFDYRLEDELIDRWTAAARRLQERFPDDPGVEIHPMPHPKAPASGLDDRGR